MILNMMIFQKLSQLGEEQLKAFWMDRLVTCKIPVSNPILLNSLNLADDRETEQQKKQHRKILV